jgi:hypothetical protein
MIVIRLKGACIVTIWHAITIDGSRVFVVEAVHDSVVPGGQATQRCSMCGWHRLVKRLATDSKNAVTLSRCGSMMAV